MLSQKVVFVTGGNRGIGKSISLKFAEQNYSVFFTYKSNIEEAQDFLKSLSSRGFNAYAVQMDVTDRKSVNNAMKKCKEIFGRINVLINNAGVNKPTDFDLISNEDWDQIFAVNLKGPFICSQEVLKFISDEGSIINIGSVSGQYGGPRTAHYAASKAGLISLGQVVARFAADRKIRCNTVAAGLIASDMAEEGMQSDAVKKAAESIPMKRLGLADEVASAALFLASNQSSYITAQTINVNGGLYF